MARWRASGALPANTGLTIRTVKCPRPSRAPSWPACLWLSSTTSSVTGCNAASVAQYLVSGLVRLALRHNLRLDTLTLGVVGVGHVGRQVCRQGRALGLRVHPNTDDPTLHHVTPTRAWSMMARDFGYTLDDLRACMLNGLEAAWIDDATRRDWRAAWTAAFDDARPPSGV